MSRRSNHSLRSNNNNFNGVSNSHFPKSKVPEVKTRKSLIPLRHPTNAGYLERHQHQQQKQNLCLNESLKSCKSTVSEKNISSCCGLLSHDQQRLCRKVGITTICRPVSPAARTSVIDLKKHSARTSIITPPTITDRGLGLQEDGTSLIGDSVEVLPVSQQTDINVGQNHGTASAVSVVELDPRPTISEEYLSLLAFARKVGQVASRTRGHFLCPICNEPLSNPSIIPCGHIFCMACVCNWFESQDNCPCCRYPVTGKDLSGDNAVLAKVFLDVSPNLASVFNAGNFYEKLEEEEEECVGTPEPLQDPSTTQAAVPSAFVLSRLITPIYKHVFDEKKNRDFSNQKDWKFRHDEFRLKYPNLAACWLLRQCYILQASEPVTSPSSDDVEAKTPYSFIQELPNLICLEAQKGTEASRESFLKKVMLMKSSTADKNSGGYNIPQSSASIDFRTVGNFPQTRIRFRVPSWQSVYKMIFISFTFITLALTVHLFEDASQRISLWNECSRTLSKLDFMVYAALLTVVVSHCELEHVGRFRRQEGERNHRRRRRNRRRRREIFDDINFS